MTIRELLDGYTGTEDFEVFRKKEGTNGPRYPFHGDYIEKVEDINLDAGVESWELMNEGTYNSTICANESIPADFGEWYDDRNAKVLCIIVR